MGLADSRMVISTVPNTSANLYLIEQVKQHNRRAVIIVTTNQVAYNGGADYVISAEVRHCIASGRRATWLVVTMMTARRLCCLTCSIK